MGQLADDSADAFRNALYGTLYGIMSWEQLSSFWNNIEPHAGWYLYAVGETVPTTTADAEHVKQFTVHIDALLRKEHEEEYCGIVYADDLERPTFVKIYDPNHLGSSCGSSKERTLPGWVMSLVPPTDLAPPVQTKARQRWWNSFLASLR